VDYKPRPIDSVPLARQRIAFASRALTPEVAFARQTIWFNGLKPGQAYDFTLRIAIARLEPVEPEALDD
jgi:hypothetical protein